MHTPCHLKDFSAIRRDFDILQQLNRGKPLIYLDSAATAQKPRQVVEAMAKFYLQDYATVHRGIYELSARATAAFENARECVRQFINADSAAEIVFVRGATEGINLVAQSYGRARWQAGDEIILSVMEHHANLVPWLQLKKELGIVLKYIPVLDDGSLDLEAYTQLFSSRTKMVAITHASNVLGTINPIKDMVATAHQYNVPVLVDGAQAVPHMPVDVLSLDCEFYVFSAHKLYGPTGVGVLYGKKELLDSMPPYQGGGAMIDTVSLQDVTYVDAPQRFEAGTPHMAGVIGMAAAMQYLMTIGMQNVYEHEQHLLDVAIKALSEVPGLRLIGTARPKVGVLSFVMASAHPHDIGTVLDYEGIAIRAGHHCAMPLMEHYQLPATVRASFGIYNQEQDIAALVQALQLTTRLFT